MIALHAGTLTGKDKRIKIYFSPISQHKPESYFNPQPARHLILEAFKCFCLKTNVYFDVFG